MQWILGPNGHGDRCHGSWRPMVMEIGAMDPGAQWSGNRCNGSWGPMVMEIGARDPGAQWSGE